MSEKSYFSRDCHTSWDTFNSPNNSSLDDERARLFDNFILSISICATFFSDLPNKLYFYHCREDDGRSFIGNIRKIMSTGSIENGKSLSFLPYFLFIHPSISDGFVREFILFIGSDKERERKREIVKKEATDWLGGGSNH